LHARSLVFRHPQSGETIKVNAPLDEDFETILAALRSDKR
ncbi:MAG TPA: RluA family pseudouridine synthase, partial [Alcanivorax sp.]|nr:RluA family pseudouridine synthase [Alcanivorax sp.]HCJ65335.1 RluA family pseudouridine synthase [Alcanivorax sp.]